MSSLRKNVASQNFTFAMINASTGAADASATVGVFVTKDNGSQASGAGTVTNSGNGQYNYAPTQAETNATDVGFLMTATGDIPVNYDFHTDIVDGNGLPSVNLVDIAGSAVSTTTAQLGVNVVSINAVATTSVAAVGAYIGNATAALAVDASGRIDVGKILGTASAGAAGYVGVDWSKLTNATATVGLTNTTVAVVTTTTTATNLTNAPTAGNFTATMKSSITTAATAATPTAAAVTGAVGSVTGAVGSVTGAVGSVTGNVGGNVTGSVGSISGVTFPTNFGALGISVGGKVSEVVLVDTLTTYTGNTVQTGDAYARLGAPAGASVSADIAAVKSNTGTTLTDIVAVKAQTDQFVFTVANVVDSNIAYTNAVKVNGAGTALSPWGP